MYSQRYIRPFASMILVDYTEIPDIHDIIVLIVVVLLPSPCNDCGADTATRSFR